MGFSGQEYWSALPFPPPEDLPDPGIEPSSLCVSRIAGRFLNTSATWGALMLMNLKENMLSKRDQTPGSPTVRLQLYELE